MLGAFVGRFGFAVCLFLIGCVFASAQNAQPPVYGFGAASCSTYLSEIKMRGSEGTLLFVGARFHLCGKRSHQFAGISPSPKSDI